MIGPQLSPLSHGNVRLFSDSNRTIEISVININYEDFCQQSTYKAPDLAIGI